jgi:hypothetical protein
MSPPATPTIPAIVAALEELLRAVENDRPSDDPPLRTRSREALDTLAPDSGKTGQAIARLPVNDHTKARLGALRERLLRGGWHAFRLEPDICLPLLQECVALLTSGACSPAAPPPGPAILPPDEDTPATRRRMTVEEANAEALHVAGRLGQTFFTASDRAQAKLIGCHVQTWRKTPLFRKKYPRGRKPTRRARRACSFTSALEDVTGKGGRDAVLDDLVAEQAAEMEPSPLEPDAPEKPRKVNVRKRV